MSTPDTESLRQDAYIHMDHLMSILDYLDPKDKTGLQSEYDNLRIEADIPMSAAEEAMYSDQLDALACDVCETIISFLESKE